MGRRTYERVHKWREKIYRKTSFLYIDLHNQLFKKKSRFPLPPAYLRDRAILTPDIDTFLNVGRESSRDIETALSRTGKVMDSFRQILDFGCGSGRILIWFANLSQSSSLYGTDIDAEAISWCRKNLDFASFHVNDPLPPMEYPSEMFDLAYSISVFTHLNEDYQFDWLNELRRIIKSQGILLLTVHGQNCWENLPSEYVLKIQKEGFLFINLEHGKKIFPKWSGPAAAFHSKEYVFDKFSKYFKILDYIPRGLRKHQDIIILQKI